MPKNKTYNTDLGGIDLGYGIQEYNRAPLASVSGDQKKLILQSQKAFTESGGAGKFVDEESGFFHRFAFARFAANNQLIDPTESPGGSDSPYDFDFPDYRGAIQKAGKEVIGQYDSGVRTAERRKSEQSSTALSSLSAVGSRSSGSGARKEKGLTSDNSLAIRRKTQLGLGGSGRGSIILG